MRDFIQFASAVLTLLTVTSDASSLTPPVLPLVVRNPYLSVWLANARQEPWQNWPIFWEGEEIGLSVLLSVSESREVYPLLGRPQDSLRRPESHDGYNVSFATYLGAQFDASTTNLSYHIPAPSGQTTRHRPVEVILSFLSPITPTSTLRQSIPASYLSIYVKGTFAVSVYVDVNGQWASGNRGSRIRWDLARIRQGKPAVGALGRGQYLKTWRVRRENEELFTEFRDQAEWGTLLFTAPNEARHESGTSSVLRQRFSRTGTLQNANDGAFRGIMQEEPVFAFSKAFHLNSSSSAEGVDTDCMTLTIAHIQDPVIQFAAARGLTMMKPLWASWFADERELTSFHSADFDDAATLAANYSSQLALDAAQSGSQNYVDIVALSARQVMGATIFAGTADDPLLFLKEISSDGNLQTIDVIYPAFPFFMYTNPRWLAYLLEPLIEHMLSGQYPNDYAMHDLGAHFPNATGHPDGRDEYMPVEECGNILIMGLALVNSLLYETPSTGGSLWSSLGSTTYEETVERSPFSLLRVHEEGSTFGLDDSWGGPEHEKGRKQARRYVERSYRLWKQWTQYLVDFSLTPENQLSTDDFAGWLANQTNLALKGIIGIRAMSGLAEAIGNTADAEHYRNISYSFIRQWEVYGLSRDDTHAKLAYHWQGSWTTLYNLFADSLLCFHLDKSSAATVIPASPAGNAQQPIESEHVSSTGFTSEHVYRLQSKWYQSVIQKYGLPLDSRHLYAKSDWEFFAAAVASRTVRAEIVEAVARWVNETSTDRPLTDLYDTEGDGGFPGIAFKARPVVGGHFSFLALERACGGKAVQGLSFLEEPTVVSEDASSMEL